LRLVSENVLYVNEPCCSPHVQVRELEKRLENFELTRNLTHTDESRRVKMLQDKLRESEEARKAAVKKWERLDEECDDLKICLRFCFTCVTPCMYDAIA
jgi:uncharacterized coiled-coil DUF342 family protein